VDFKSQKKYIEEVREIDISKFNTVKEITQMIDFLNKEKEKNSNKHMDNEINAISKYYAPLLLRELRGEQSKIIR
jgi:hypothetical protein